MDPQLKARMIVADYHSQNSMVGYFGYWGRKKISVDNTYVVWFSKTLQNWKALVGVDLRHDIYYEVTYDGEQEKTYLDVYTKTDNIAVSDDIFEASAEESPEPQLIHFIKGDENPPVKYCNGEPYSPLPRMGQRTKLCDDCFAKANAN